MNTVATVRTDTRFTVVEYLAFIETRPSEERWQLIDGVAMMMPPPTLRHQRIASNLAFELNAHFRASAKRFTAYQEIGLIVPEVDRFRPEADVAVLDDATDLDTPYADRFYLVAEVLSESNADADVAIKRERYVRHPDNLYCLVIAQTQISVDLWSRDAADKDWAHMPLTEAAAELRLPAFDFVVPVAALYAGTPLATAAR